MRWHRRPKPRGNKRYYRKLQAWVTSFPERGDVKFANFEHWHPDFRGRSRFRTRHHRSRTEFLFHAFKELAKFWQTKDIAHQIWVEIKNNEWYRDTLYLHTRNLILENFPYDFENVDWNVPPPNIIEGLYDKSLMVVGLSADKKVYVVKYK